MGTSRKKGRGTPEEYDEQAGGRGEAQGRRCTALGEKDTDDAIVHKASICPSSWHAVETRTGEIGEEKTLFIGSSCHTKEESGVLISTRNISSEEGNKRREDPTFPSSSEEWHFGTTK